MSRLQICSKCAPSKQRNEACSCCVETPELALDQEQPAHDSVIPARLTSMENHCPCIVQKAVQRIHVLRCYRKCIIHLQIFSIFLSFSLVFLFPQKVFPSEYVNLLRQEVTFVYVFIRHKHKEHLLAEKDTVAKQIKNVGRKQRCTQAH